MLGRAVSDKWPFEGRHAADVLEAVDVAVDAAATKLVRKAFKLISVEDTTPRKDNPSTSSLDPPSSRSPLFKFDSGSFFLDKGLDAITGVGKLVEGFAVTLDNAIGQAFEEWGTGTPLRSSATTPLHRANSKTISRQQQSCNREQHADHISDNLNPSPQSPRVAWGDFDVAAEDSASEIESFAPTKPSSAKSIASLKTLSPSRAAPSSKRTNTNEDVQQWRRRSQPG